MIRRLKRSFVTVTMLSAALVLVILMGIVNLTNYIERTNSDREILSYLAENGGRFPVGKDIDDDHVSSGEPTEENASEEMDFTATNDPDGTPPLWDGKGGHRRGFTVETQYETRYFSVFLPVEGDPFVDTSQIAAVTGEEAAALAQSLPAADGKVLRSGNYRYTTVTGEYGVLYVFLDCTRSIGAVRTFLINSVVVTAGGLIVLFGLAWLFSGKAVRPIAESYEKQKSFITNAGHELKTPLAVIESSTEVIELENGESQWTQSIHGQVRRLTTLTQELIALARMDENSDLALSEIDLSAVTEEALEPFAMLAEQKGFGFAAELQPGVRCRANREAVEKICAILADNAVKYTAPGGAIRFTLTQEGGHAVLREENPAEGLAPGSQERLFDRFYRADTSHNSAQPGYGLGLPLARSLSEAMGGKMKADSPDGKRLVVTVQL